MRSALPDGTDGFANELHDRYRIEREVGRGGMASVYLAEDLRHGRRVAIKVLHSELAAVVGSDRFLSEIRTTATLQHPHILGLIDSGEAAGVLYYVMPFVDGESLRDRLSREHQLPIEEAVRLAREIAAALDYAHRHLVVHRDIKPENILLQDGNALVSDFGIALAITTAGGMRLTQTGVSLGTPQYMAPEQAIGDPMIDARADLYALGAVTYEMLVGQPPFVAPTVQATFASAMTDTPRALRSQRQTIPPYVESAVLKALEKLPADRFSTAKEFAAALLPPAGWVAPALPRRGPRAPVIAGLVGLAALLALGVGWFLGRRAEPDRSASYPPSRLAIAGPRIGATAWSALHRQLTLTPDGMTLIYVVMTADGKSQLVRQSLEDAEPASIPDIRSATSAILLAPDGRRFIGWAAPEREAYRYSLTGGPSSPVLFPGGFTPFAQWDERGIWFTPNNGGGLWRLDPNDSTARLVSPASQGLRLQQFLPDRRHLLAMSRASTQSGPAVIYDLQTGEKTPLISTAIVEVRYVAGFLVYVLPNGTFEAAPFDVESRRITGPAVSIGTGVSVTGTGVAQIAVASNGTIAYIVEEPQSLVLADRAGAFRAALDARHNYHNPRFSPDGRRISVDFISADGRDVWILSLEDGTLTRATFERDAHDATWTPDGESITYTSARTGAVGIYRKRTTGTGPGQLLFAAPQIAFTGVWLRDTSGLLTAANDLHPGSDADIAVVRNGGRGPLEPLVATEFTEGFPALSPDGQWVAFTSDRTGRSEVYVLPLRGDRDQFQVSIEGGIEPAWAPDGRTIYYRSLGQGEPHLVAADLRINPSMVITARRSLFPVADIIGANPHANYDVSPDGKTFVMVRRSPATRIMVIQNLPGLVRHLQGAQAPHK
jgi:predicted RNase H-related nuclease YkuK (DUF458 family)